MDEDSDETPAGASPPCPDCRTALASTGRDAVSFLLVDSLTIPVVGCEVHLEQLRLLCGITADETAKLLSHRPAGGIQCPGCRGASRSHEHPVVRIGHGAAVVLACETHEADVLERLEAGLRARGELPRGGRL